MDNVSTVNKLRNGAFLQCMKNVASIFESHDAGALALEVRLKELRNCITDMSAVYNAPTAHELTPELYALDFKRNRALRGLRGTIEYQQFREEEAAVKAAKLLKNAFRQQGETVEKQPQQQKTASIQALMKELNEKPMLSNAVEALGLKEWMSTLDSINREFDRKYVARAGTKTQSPLLREKKARLRKAYDELVKDLESHARVSKDNAEYISIIVKLNNLIESYGSSVQGRSGERKKENKAETVM